LEKELTIFQTGTVYLHILLNLFLGPWISDAASMLLQKDWVSYGKGDFEASSLPPLRVQILDG